MNQSNEQGNGPPTGPNWSRINQWLLWIGLAAAVAWMFFRHGAHLGQLLPFLILLACPLMHLFGHGGHGGHGDGFDNQAEDGTRQLPPGGRSGHHH